MTLAFILGLFIGTPIGFLLAAILTASARADALDHASNVHREVDGAGVIHIIHEKGQ